MIQHHRKSPSWQDVYLSPALLPEHDTTDVTALIDLTRCFCQTLGSRHDSRPFNPMQQQLQDRFWT